MSAAISIFYRPTFITFGSRSSKLKSLKPNLFKRFSSGRSGFGGGSAVRTMTEMVKTSAFRSGRSSGSSSGGSSSSNIEEGVRVIEEEALIDGSSQLVAAGFEPTLNRLSKWLVSALFGAVILWRHDAEALWALMGSVVNSILSVGLKRLLNQERPVSTLRSDPGMPSSHAQSIFFIVSFTILTIVELLGINEATLIISGLALAFGSYLSWLRVSQQLHTISQVAVGAAVGSSFSILWFLSWNDFVLEAFVCNLWVRIIVFLGAAGFSVGFLVYVIRNWFRDGR